MGLCPKTRSAISPSVLLDIAIHGRRSGARQGWTGLSVLSRWSMTLTVSTIDPAAPPD